MAEVIEKLSEWRVGYEAWQQRHEATSDDDRGYPFIENKRAPFTPARRALPMLNLALISSAGAYLDGTDPFDTTTTGGDTICREIPSEIEGADLLFSARGYDPAAVLEDVNAQIPLNRLREFEANGVIGQLNSVFWSFCGFIPDGGRLVNEMLPRLIERLHRYEVQAALLIPASRIGHQTVSLAARAIEVAGIPTMTLAVQRDVIESVRPPRAGYYAGQLGAVAGAPSWPEHQRRVLDEALRLIEPMDEPGILNLAVELESAVEVGRGER